MGELATPEPTVERYVVSVAVNVTQHGLRESRSWVVAEDNADTVLFMLVVCEVNESKDCVTTTVIVAAEHEPV